MRVIAKVDAQLPADATLKQRKAALKEVAYNYHGGTYWGRKMWGQECRKYLERHGQPPRAPRPVEASPRFADDIVFPYRTPTVMIGGGV
jgi:hypothetical protein